MEKKNNSRIELIIEQLELIDETNKTIKMFKKKKDKLMISQYEHLKKGLIQNLFKILDENYQIPIPSLKKEAA